MSVIQILAIFTESFFKRVAVYFHGKTFLGQSFALLLISNLIKIGIYRQIGVIGLAKSKKKVSFSLGQTPTQHIAIVARNMHVVCVWPPYYHVVRYVGCCWLKFDHF